MPPPLTHPWARAAASPQAASSPLSNRAEDCSPPGGRAWVGGLPRSLAKPRQDGFTYFIKRTNTDPKSQPCKGPGAQLVQLPTSQTGDLQSVATTAPRPHCCGSSEGCPPAPGKYKFPFTHCPPLTFQASSPHFSSLPWLTQHQTPPPTLAGPQTVPRLLREHPHAWEGPHPSSG